MEENKNQKLLSLFDLISLATGMIIGSGVMTMLGIAVGLTGRSVIFALLAAAVLTLICTLPQVYISGTMNFPGGYYTMFATLCNKKLAGIYTYVNLFTVTSISFASLSFASYFLSLVPGINATLVCVVLMTGLLILHLIGVKEVAMLQNVMMIVLLLSLAIYIVFGLGHVDADYFAADSFMTGGAPGFVLACVFLTFAFGGGTFIVNYSSAAKNPRRNIPLAILISTLSVALFYALIAVVTAGVLPVSEVADQPLSVPAAVFLPSGLYTFFVVGGAMFALLTSINFYIGSMVYPSVTACQDGWLPKWLLKKNKRFGTHHRILLLIYIASLTPILLGIDMKAAANCTIILTMVIFVIACLACLQMPKKAAAAWEKSSYHCGTGFLKTLCFISIVLLVVSIVLLIATSAPAEIIGNILVLAISLVFGIGMSKRATITALETQEEDKK